MDVENELSQNTTQDVTLVEADYERLEFTRYLLLERIGREDSIKKAYGKIFKDDKDADYMTEVLTEINVYLKKSNMEITTTTCEISGKKNYVVIATNFRPNMIWPNIAFNENTMKFIRDLIHEIVCSDYGIVSRTLIINNNKYLSNEEANEVLTKLEEMHYLLMPKKDKYVFSSLALKEFDPFFTSCYKDVLTDCHLCKKRIIFGLCCPKCNQKVHVACFKHFRSSTNEKKCANCNKTWDEDTIAALKRMLDLNIDTEVCGV